MGSSHDVTWTKPIQKFLSIRTFLSREGVFQIEHIFLTDFIPNVVRCKILPPSYIQEKLCTPQSTSVSTCQPSFINTVSLVLRKFSEISDNSLTLN